MTVVMLSGEASFCHISCPKVVRDALVLVINLLRLTRGIRVI